MVYQQTAQYLEHYIRCKELGESFVDYAKANDLAYSTFYTAIQRLREKGYITEKPSSHSRVAMHYRSDCIPILSEKERLMRDIVLRFFSSTLDKRAYCSKTGLSVTELNSYISALESLGISFKRVIDSVVAIDKSEVYGTSLDNNELQWRRLIEDCRRQSVCNFNDWCQQQGISASTYQSVAKQLSSSYYNTGKKPKRSRTVLRFANGESLPIKIEQIIWLIHSEDYIVSGESQQAYCRHHNLPYKTFNKYFLRFKDACILEGNYVITSI